MGLRLGSGGHEVVGDEGKYLIDTGVVFILAYALSAVITCQGHADRVLVRA